MQLSATSVCGLKIVFRISSDMGLSVLCFVQLVGASTLLSQSMTLLSLSMTLLSVYDSTLYVPLTPSSFSCRRALHCYVCVLTLLCMCPHTAIYVSSYGYVCVLTLLYMSSYGYVCVLILLYMCPHTAMYVSSHCYICVLIRLYVCPHTAIFLYHPSLLFLFLHKSCHIFFLKCQKSVCISRSE